MVKLKNIENLKEACEEAMRSYKYQQELTNRLDSHEGDFTETTILEIVLWKTNRYPKLAKGVIEDINNLRKEYTEEKARNLLRKLLSDDSKGFDLPMASTVLRFAVPDHLQIIDQRVYRFITTHDHLKTPHNVEKKIELYFDYIRTLRQKCDETGVSFNKSDRVFYQLDKKQNKDFKLRTS
jgi:thermostable 8-oxoguanine DNA glycosylase